MILRKSELLKVLGFVMPGIETGNAVLQGADTFVFYKGRVFTYNDIISVSAPLNELGLVSENVEGAVRADEFFKIIRKFPTEEITFSTKDNSWLLTSGKSKVEMTLVDFDYKTRFDGIEPASEWIEINNEDFISGIRCCKIPNNKTALSGMFFSGRNVITSDGYQINKYELKDVELPTFYLSDRCIDELLKVGNFSEVQINGSWVHFKCKNGVIFTEKLLNADKYPFDKVLDLLNAIDTSRAFHTHFPKLLSNAIDRAALFDMNMNNKQVVIIELSENGIEVSSERASGKFSEKVDWEETVKDFEPIVFYVQPDTMLAICSKTLDVYVVERKSAFGKKNSSLFFKTPQSVHLMSVFAK